MAYHNPTCGCAECGNYGQRYNPSAIHNQSCGCAACGNYGASVPVNHGVSMPVDGSINLPVNYGVSMPVDGSVNLPVNRGVSMQVDGSINLPATRSGGAPVSSSRRRSSPQSFGEFSVTPELRKRLHRVLGDCTSVKLRDIKSFSSLLKAIDASMAPQAKKEELKDLLKAVVSQPDAVKTLGSRARTLAKELAVKTQAKKAAPAKRQALKRLVTCPDCNTQVRSDRLEAHRRNVHTDPAKELGAKKAAPAKRQVSKRLVTCPDCNTQVRLDLLEAHRRNVHTDPAKSNASKKRVKKGASRLGNTTNKGIASYDHMTDFFLNGPIIQEWDSD